MTDRDPHAGRRGELDLSRVRRKAEDTVDQVKRRIQGPLHRRLTLALQVILLIGFVAAVWQRQ